MVTFSFNGAKTIIQCKPDTKVKDIILKFINKSQINKNDVFFTYSSLSGAMFNEELTFYEACLLKKTKKSEFVLNYKYTYSIKNDIYDEYEELEYKPSELLLDYLEIIDFGKNKKRIIREFEDDEEFYDNEDQDLSALFDFSMNFKELKERFINECNLEPRLFTSTFSSMFQEETGKKRKKRDQEINEQVNDILKNQLLKNLKNS